MIFPRYCLPLALASLVNGLSTTTPSNKSVPGLDNGMDYVKLGSSDLLVSKVCMGTMTFGEQNTIDEGVEQLNLAWDDYGTDSS
mmetsp:Transcript_5843/g.8578  ORF Transcript_5843/g.8578 Transcript_5843/m.8578 type:complete len:84 (+) Transcript_5843:150-401(+)